MSEWAGMDRIDMVAEIERLRAENEDLRGALGYARDTREEMDAEVERLRAELQTQAVMGHTLQSDHTALIAEMEAIRRDIGAAEERLADTRKYADRWRAECDAMCPVVDAARAWVVQGCPSGGEDGFDPWERAVADAVRALDGAQ